MRYAMQYWVDGGEMGVRVEGVDYSPDGVQGVWAEVVELRNKALVNGDMREAVMLSHCLAYLADYKEALEVYGKP